MKNNILPHRRRAQAGFTLIELSIVVLIVGLMLSAFGAAFVQYMQTAREKAVQQKIEDIETALGRFLALNGRYPCPARMIAPPDSASFGVEVNTNCGAGAIGGTFRATGTDGRMVRIGAVPTRTLNLPDDYALDSWSMRILYGVTEVLASPGTFAQNRGAFSIVDSNGNSVITPPGSGHYAVISVGPDAMGSYTAQGAAGPACVAARLDGENCDNDATLRATVLYSAATGNTHFDDYITYAGARALDGGVPPGAVMPFNLNACPNGWAAYAPAVGRAVVGTGRLDETYAPADRVPWSASANYGLGDTGGFMTWRLNQNEMPRHNHAVPMVAGSFASLLGVLGLIPSPIPVFTGSATTASGRSTFDAGDDAPHQNMPPYVALLYCQKL